MPLVVKQSHFGMALQGNAKPVEAEPVKKAISKNGGTDKKHGNNANQAQAEKTENSLNMNHEPSHSNVSKKPLGKFTEHKQRKNSEGSQEEKIPEKSSCTSLTNDSTAGGESCCPSKKDMEAINLINEKKWHQAFWGGLVNISIIIGILAVFFALFDSFAPVEHREGLRTAFGNVGNYMSMVNIINDRLSELFPPELGVDMGAVGQRLKKEGIHAKHPLVLVPGFVTSGLEAWESLPCQTLSFRTRLWTTMAMVQSALLNGACWFDHMRLDTYTNLDPPGVRLRSAEGLEAATFFLPGYFVWNMLVENLAAIGYDSTNMLLMPFDWRLSYGNMQARDQYFLKLKHQVEYLVHGFGQKVVISAHSMGAPVLFYFFKWIEDPAGGNAPGWVDKHVHAVANIAGVFLGTPKAASALISGEMKDTSVLGEVGQLLELSNWSRRSRRDLFRSWHSLAAMLPRGGNAVWGNLTMALDDTPELRDKGYTYGSMVQFEGGAAASHENITVEQLASLLANTDPKYQEVLEKVGFPANSNSTADSNYNPQESWYDPLRSPLPNAPNMKVYCLYGVGKDTERAYMYKAASADGQSHVPYHIATSFSDGAVRNGVFFGPGDGSVPLISLGYMCAKGWAGKNALNPGGAEAVVREYPHNPHPVYPRGGENSADHVDIMGNVQLNEDILRLAAGQSLTPSITSDIMELSEMVHSRLHGTA